jgi:Kef-type K+ transport system membrane component KefB
MNIQNHPTNQMLIILIIIFSLAIIAKSIKLINQPIIIGEIILGILLTNIGLSINHNFVSSIIHNEFLINLATLGSIFLLLEIGLETEFNDLIVNKKYAIITAITGVVIPFICGYFIVPYIFSNENQNLQIFMGSFFAVTSTGISISVFKELKILKTQSCQIVLGASIIDDIIGLLLLSITVSIIKFNEYNYNIIFTIILKLLIFFILLYIVNKFILKNIFKPFIKQKESLLIIIICYTLLCSYSAEKIGLAMIIGAFLAGITINNSLSKIINHNFYLELIAPLRTLFTPIFFIYSGMQINISNLFNYKLILISLIIGFFAIISKLSSSILLPKKLNKKIIGFGMVPRGEIGLIFAVTGLNLGLYSNQIFTILMLVIIYTTIITPVVINHIVKHN